MAVVYIQEFPIADRTTKNYDFVADKIGDGPFDGLIAHTAGFDDDTGVFGWHGRADGGLDDAAGHTQAQGGAEHRRDGRGRERRVEGE